MNTKAEIGTQDKVLVKKREINKNRTSLQWNIFIRKVQDTVDSYSSKLITSRGSVNRQRDTLLIESTSIRKIPGWILRVHENLSVIINNKPLGKENNCILVNTDTICQTPL